MHSDMSSKKQKFNCTIVSVCVFQNCSENDPPCPVGYLEKIVFEMDKKYAETKLQVLVSPVTLHINDNYQVSLYKRYPLDQHPQG